MKINLSTTLHMLTLIFSSCLIPLSNSVADANHSLNYDVSLRNIHGKEKSLASFIGQGQWVVLNIWGTRCPPCREEIPELNQFHDTHQSDDAIVVSIAIDFPSYQYANEKEVREFADDYLIDYPILLSDSTITDKIGLGRLQGLPTTYLFNPSGKVVGMQVGGITKKILEDFIDKKKFR